MPTLYRLCQKLNLSGLLELRVKLSGALDSYIAKKQEYDFDYPIQKYQTHYKIMTNLKEDYHLTTLSTFNLLDLEMLRAALIAMTKAKHIDIYVSAGNVYFALNFQFQMSEIGIKMYLLKNMHNACLWHHVIPPNHSFIWWKRTSSSRTIVYLESK